MSSLEVVEEIAAPVESVFDLLTDLSGAAERISGIDKVEVLTEGEFGVGTRWRETRTMMGKSATEEMTVSAFEPGRSFMTVAESSGCRYESGFRCEPTEGGTSVTFSFRGEAASTGAKVMMTLMAPFNWLIAQQMKKMIQADLADIRRAAEAAGAPQAGA